METVALWDNQSLTKHIIKNDLQNLRGIYDSGLNTYIRERNIGTLHRSIFLLQGIYEYPLQVNFLRHYKLQRNIVNKLEDPTNEDFEHLAEKILLSLNRKRDRASSVITSQKSIRMLTDIKYFLNQLCINLIDNDLIFKSQKNTPYPCTLHEPILWLMKNWDPKIKEKVEEKYFTILSESDPRSTIKRGDNYIPIAEEIFNELRFYSYASHIITLKQETAF